MNRRILARTTSLVPLAALTAALLAACGGGQKPPAGSASTGSENHNFSSLKADAYKYAACMRNHGVSGFPDPHVVDNQTQHTIGFIAPSLAMRNSPAFKHAQKTCKGILPMPKGNQSSGPSPAQQKEQEDALLALARCMRSHGFPSFPDPNSQGQVTAAMLSKAGIDFRQPALKPAADSCASVTHGVITEADVNQAIAHLGTTTSESSPAGG